MTTLAKYSYVAESLKNFNFLVTVFRFALARFLVLVYSNIVCTGFLCWMQWHYNQTPKAKSSLPQVWIYYAVKIRICGWHSIRYIASQWMPSMFLYCSIIYMYA